MSPERLDRDLLGDMQEAGRRIVTYTGGMTYDEFLADLRTQDAVIRNLEIMGEMCTKPPAVPSLFLPVFSVPPRRVI